MSVPLINFSRYPIQCLKVFCFYFANHSYLQNKPGNTDFYVMHTVFEIKSWLFIRNMELMHLRKATLFKHGTAPSSWAFHHPNELLEELDTKYLPAILLSLMTNAFKNFYFQPYYMLSPSHSLLLPSDSLVGVSMCNSILLAWNTYPLKSSMAICSLFRSRL